MVHVLIYYIYHIPGVKIGVTQNLAKRIKEQGFTDYELLEEHTCIYEVSKREIELQKEYGLRVDNTPYHVTMAATEKSRNAKVGARAFNRAHNKTFTPEQVAEIRAKYVPWKYSQNMLAREYGTSQRVICYILNGVTYKD